MPETSRPPDKFPSDEADIHFVKKDTRNTTMTLPSSDIHPADRHVVAEGRYAQEIQALAQEFARPGSGYTIETFNLTTPISEEAIQVYAEMDAQQNANVLVGKKLTQEDRDEITKLLQDGSTIFIRKDKEIVGWVNIYDPGKKFLENAIQTGIIPPNTQVLEVSFLARESTKIRGVVAAGLVYVMDQLTSGDIPMNQVSQKEMTADNIAFIGSIEDENLLSQHLHEATGFTKFAKPVRYDGRSKPCAFYSRVSPLTRKK